MNVEATRDLSCIELVELVTDYLEGVLDAAYLVQMHHTITLTGQLRPDDIPPTP